MYFSCPFFLVYPKADNIVTVFFSYCQNLFEDILPYFVYSRGGVKKTVALLYIVELTNPFTSCAT